MTHTDIEARAVKYAEENNDCYSNDYYGYSAGATFEREMHTLKFAEWCCERGYTKSTGMDVWYCGKDTYKTTAELFAIFIKETEK